MKRVLLTGCAGFIGSHLTARFLTNGYSVVGLDNLSRPGSRLNLDYLRALKPQRLEFVEADIRNVQAVNAAFIGHGPFDLIVHEAAQVAVTTSVTNPREDFEINAGGTLNILEAMRTYSPEAFLQFASTNKVYGTVQAETVVERDGRYQYEALPAGVSETCSLDFHSPYGCSKGAADQYVRDYSRTYGLRTVVLRQSCIYGTRQFGVEDQGWISWFVIAAALGRPVTIYGDGKQVRDVLWCDDLVSVYERLYEKADAVAGEVFNVGGGPRNTLSLIQLVEHLKSRGVLTQPVGYSSWRPGDQKVFVSDIEKIKQRIGWEPTVQPEEGVSRLITWVSANRALLQAVLA